MSFPSNPVNGQSYTAPSGVVYVYDSNNTAWNISGGTSGGSSGLSFTTSTTAPTGMNPGAMWFHPTSRVLSIYVYDGTSYSWVDVSTIGAAGSGLSVVTANTPLSGSGTSASPLSIGEATEATVGAAKIVTQANADSSTAASANDTDILTMKKLLNLSNPAKAALQTSLGTGGTSSATGPLDGSSVGSYSLATSWGTGMSPPSSSSLMPSSPGTWVARGGGQTAFTNVSCGCHSYGVAYLFQRIA